MFIDDLNMPQPNAYGSQLPLEVLREFLDYNGFYDTKQLRWKEVFNVTLLAACGVSSNSHRKPSSRLIQKFRYF